MSEPGAGRAEEPRRLEQTAAVALEAIPGVLAAAVWLRAPGLVREAYVTGAPGASVAALRRVAGEVLTAHGLVAPAHSLFIATLDEHDTPPTLLRGRFLVLDGLEVTRADHFVTCRVRLVRRGRTATGEARELDTELGRARAAARATLLAAQEATSGVRLGLEGIQLLEAFGRRYVLLSIEAAFARRFSHLPGAAVLDRSVEDGACLSTLTAIERWIAW